MDFFYGFNDMLKGIDAIHVELEKNAASQGKDNMTDTIMLELFFHLVWHGFTDEEIMGLSISDYDFVGKKFKNYDVKLHEETITLIERSCRLNQLGNGKYATGQRLIRGIKEGFDLSDLMRIKNALNVSKEFKQNHLKRFTYPIMARCYMYNKFMEIEQNTGVDVWASGVALKEVIRMIHIMPTTHTTLYRKEYKEFKNSYPTEPVKEQQNKVELKEESFNKEDALKTIEQIEIMLSDLKKKLK